MTTTSYWLDRADEPIAAFAAAGARGRVDVIVVGGGVTGCSCALTLAQGGMRVRVHEAHVLAAGASGRNGGFALRGAAMAYDRAQAAVGVDNARSLWRLTERSLARLSLLAGDAFRPVGSLRLAASDDEANALGRELDALRADGFAGSWLDALPAPLDRLYVGAMVSPRDGATDPVRWIRRLARHATDAGAEIIEGSRADPAALDAPAIVIAVDGLTGTVVPELEPFVQPIRGQMLATEPIHERLYERPHYARQGYDYWQQLPDGRLVVGGKRDASFETEQTAVEEATQVVQEQLDALVVELLGRLPRITHRWAGIWGETTDLLPFAGVVPGRDGVWVAGGYSGHGNVLGLACGDLVARAILGEEPPELGLFDPARVL